MATDAERAEQAEAALARARDELETLNRVRVESYRIPKIPAFFRSDPELWFIQVESTFWSARITDSETKAHHVIAALSSEVATCCRDIMIAPADGNLFERIKQRIISTYAPSAESKLRQLLKGQVLTDGKPSQILHRLRNLNADGRCDDTLLKQIFVDNLPVALKGILASSSEKDLTALAELADKISEATGATHPVVAAVRPNASPCACAGQVEQITASIAALTARFDRFERTARSKSRGRSGNNRKVTRGKERPELCWAHKKFGASAYACKGTAEAPCRWPIKTASEN